VSILQRHTYHLLSAQGKQIVLVSSESLFPQLFAVHIEFDDVSIPFTRSKGFRHPHDDESTITRLLPRNRIMLIHTTVRFLPQFLSALIQLQDIKVVSGKAKRARHSYNEVTSIMCLLYELGRVGLVSAEGPLPDADRLCLSCTNRRNKQQGSENTEPPAHLSTCYGSDSKLCSPKVWSHRGTRFRRSLQGCAEDTHSPKLQVVNIIVQTSHEVKIHIPLSIICFHAGFSMIHGPNEATSTNKDSPSLNSML